MNVAEFIETLAQLPQHAEVLLSCDAEGNEFSGFGGLDIAYTEPGYDGGRLEYLVYREDLEEAGEDTDDLDETHGLAVVLWPI